VLSWGIVTALGKVPPAQVEHPIVSGAWSGEHGAKTMKFEGYEEA